MPSASPHGSSLAGDVATPVVNQRRSMLQGLRRCYQLRRMICANSAQPRVLLSQQAHHLFIQLLARNSQTANRHSIVAAFSERAAERGGRLRDGVVVLGVWASVASVLGCRRGCGRAIEPTGCWPSGKLAH